MGVGEGGKTNKYFNVSSLCNSTLGQRQMFTFSVCFPETKMNIKDQCKANKVSHLPSSATVQAI